MIKRRLKLLREDLRKESIHVSKSHFLISQGKTIRLSTPFSKLRGGRWCVVQASKIPFLNFGKIQDLSRRITLKINFENAI